MEELVEKWEEIKNFIEEDCQLSSIAFQSWIKPLEVYKIEETTIYILFNDKQQSNAKFVIDYINKKFTTHILFAIAEITKKQFNEIVYLTTKEVEEKAIPNINIEGNEIAQNINNDNNTINPKYTFENFVIGTNNRFAQTAALAVAESPGESYNPLFIYGGPGLGKTHLMHAIGNYICNQNPNNKVLYVTSEDFTNEVIENMRTNNNASAMQKFRDKYRSVDVLMVDDIQFIIGKERTQEEFFNTFNTLHSLGKQIVITSDKPPKEMETLNDRFRSRFDMGLMADIGYPDYETRMAILSKKIEEKNFSLSEDIRKYIGENIKSSIREIEGALNKLIAYSALEKTEITMEIAERELVNYVSPNVSREITPQLIIEVVAEHFNITVDQMTSKNRTGTLVRPRHIAMYLCNTMTSSSTKAIGKLLGGRDHSTIIHGAKKIEDEIKEDENTKKTIENIKKKINPN